MDYDQEAMRLWGRLPDEVAVSEQAWPRTIKVIAAELRQVAEQARRDALEELGKFVADTLYVCPTDAAHQMVSLIGRHIHELQDARTDTQERTMK